MRPENLSGSEGLGLTPADGWGRTRREETSSVHSTHTYETPSDGSLYRSSTVCADPVYGPPESRLWAESGLW